MLASPDDITMIAYFMTNPDYMHEWYRKNADRIWLRDYYRMIDDLNDNPPPLPLPWEEQN